MKYKMTISGTMPDDKLLSWPMASEVKTWLEDLGFEFETLEVTESYADIDDSTENGNGGAA